MRQRTMRQQAWRQGLGAAIAVALLAGAAVTASRHPTDATGLKAEVSVLRSQAAEAQLLIAQAPELAPRFVRAHARQLGQNIDRENERVRGLRVEPALTATHESARAAARRLQQLVRPLADGEQEAKTAEEVADVLAQLQQLEQSLRR